jgi:hypothetical protein
MIAPSLLQVDECASSPCLNNATCRDVFRGYQCACVEGWSGRLCEEDVDECAAHAPCPSHNHTCENHAGGYSCVCPSGYSGHVCEREIDECESAPCRNQVTSFPSNMTLFTSHCSTLHALRNAFLQSNTRNFVFILHHIRAAQLRRLLSKVSESSWL